MGLSVERIVPEPRRTAKRVASVPKRRCRVLRGIFFGLGCLLVGAFMGAIIGTPPIRDLNNVPNVGTHTGIGAGVGAVLFLIGGFLLRSAREGVTGDARRRARAVVGCLLLGVVVGGFLGTMFAALGRGIGAELGALLFMIGGAATVTRGRGAGRPSNWRWTFLSMLLIALAAASVSVFFPVVRDTYTLALPRGLLLVTAPVAVVGAILGLLFATHTGRRRTLTILFTLTAVVAALLMLGAYHAPLRELRFPADRALGEIRYARWLDYVTQPAQGVIRVPVYGDTCLHATGDEAGDLNALAQAQGLAEIDLSGASITDAHLAHLAKLGGLTWLGLNGTPIGDAGLAHLAGLRALKTLLLGGTRVTDAGLKSLAGLAALEELNLESTAISDAGLVHVKSLGNLQSLTLFGTNVTDAGLAHLAVLRRLRHLDLYQTRVSTEGVERLQRHLPACRIGAAPAPRTPEPQVVVEAAPAADLGQPVPAANTAALSALPDVSEQ